MHKVIWTQNCRSVRASFFDLDDCSLGWSGGGGNVRPKGEMSTKGGSGGGGRFTQLNLSGCGKSYVCIYLGWLSAVHAQLGANT